MPREVNPGLVRQFVDLLKVAGGYIAETFTNVAALSANRLVTSIRMNNTPYTLTANTSPSDGYAHLVQLTRSVVSGADTPGTVTFTGIDAAGNIITDVLIPGANGVVVEGVKAFKTVTAIVGAGWAVDAGVDYDTIVCGFSAKVGLSNAIAADADLLNVYDASSLATTAAFTGKGDGTVAGSYFTPTGANATLDYVAVYRPVQDAALLSNGAATLATLPALGFITHVEEFGFRVREALVGAGGTLTFTLCTTAGSVIATLVVPLASGAAGATIRTTTMVSEALARIPDTGTLVLKRTATGTAFTSGSGEFYARLAQRPQARI